MAELDNEQSGQQEIPAEPMAVEEIPAEDFMAPRTRDLVKALAEPTVADFEVVGHLASGTFACVLEVIHKETNISYAMKIQPTIWKVPCLMDMLKSRTRLRLEREERISMAVDFEFVTRAHYFFQDYYHVYLVSELAPYGDLVLAWEGHPPVNEVDTRFVIAQCVLALEYLHSAEVAHRDIKPANVLLCADGYAKVTDFGLSTQLKHGKTWTLAGTVGYFAPEILQEQGYGVGIDWYSLGRVTLVILGRGREFIHWRELEELPNNLIEAAKTHCGPDAIDFIEQLLQNWPEFRLGVRGDGSPAVRSHPWFKELNWETLYAKRYNSPFVHLAEIQANTDWQEAPNVPGTVIKLFSSS